MYDYFRHNLFLTLLLSAPLTASDPQVPKDPMNTYIIQMLENQKDKTLCTSSSDTIESIRMNVLTYVQFNDSSAMVTTNSAAKALWHLYPCPFSPYRGELRASSSEDIEGVWIFPDTSQKIRFGSASDRKSMVGAMPITCDAVGYFPDGELRHAIIAGRSECPFKKSTDFDIARKNPRVSTWTLTTEGKIVVTRTDVANHIEEWDVYTVDSPFIFDEIQFEKGDIIAYLRKENGNEVGASTQFRHLKRLQ